MHVKSQSKNGSTIEPEEEDDDEENELKIDTAFKFSLRIVLFWGANFSC